MSVAHLRTSAASRRALRGLAGALVLLASPTLSFAQTAGSAPTAPEPMLREEGPFPGSPASFADLSEGLIDSVVNISTSQTMQQQDGVPMPDLPPGSPFEDFFQEFFDQQNRSDTPRRVSSLGSGFVI